MTLLSQSPVLHTCDEFRLVKKDVISQEIGLTAEQKERLKPLIDEDAKLFADLYKVFRDKMRKEAERAGGKPSYELMVKLSDESEDELRLLAEVQWLKLKSSLTVEQSSRLRGIHIQMAEGQALFYPDVAESLSLTIAQKEKLEGLRTEFRAKMRAAEAVSVERGYAVKAQRNEAECGVLTADQRANFEQLKGKPFDLKPLLRSE